MYFHLGAAERHIINEQDEQHWTEEAGILHFPFPSKTVEKNLFLYLVKGISHYMVLKVRLVISEKNKMIY